MKLWVWAGGIGVVIGAAYTVSPLSVIALVIVIATWRAVSAGVTGVERRWLIAIVLAALLLRGAALAGLFLTADPDIPYANFFGDEEFFKRKTTWLRNVALGIPISTADYIYAFDKTGDNGYVSLLTFLQALVGLAPYGIHVLNTSLYIAATLLLYGVSRAAFGGAAALAGLSLLFFLPSLFFWSISALKEPVYFLVAAANIVAAIAIVRQPRWWGRMAAVAALVIGAYALQRLREGGLMLATAGALGGLTMAWLVRRPRLLVVATAVVLPLAATAVLTVAPVQDRVTALIREGAMKHWGHVNTAGQSYQLMDRAFYIDRQSVLDMTNRDVAVFSVRALWAYATVPLPWHIESRSALAFVPEQLVWFLILGLTPVGAVIALRRDALVASLLLAHGTVAAVMVALSGGNVGTLVRHRGLAMPYLAWLAGLGLVVLVTRVLARQSASPADSQTHDPSKEGLAWHS